MESKKLFNEVFEEVNDVNISGGAGATDAQCHHWYVEGFSFWIWNRAILL